MKSSNIAEIFFTTYDAYYTVIYKSGRVVQYPQFKKPEFKDIAQEIHSFRFDIDCINRVFEVQQSLKAV